MSIQTPGMEETQSGGLLGIFNPPSGVQPSNTSAAGALGQIAQIAATYGGPTSYATSFFNNPNNAAATQSAVDMYGIPGAYGGDGWRNQVGWCVAYGPINDLYYLALFFSKYPEPADSELNCQTLKGFISALDQERINADAKYAADNEPCAHSSAIKAANDLQGVYNGMYAGLSCDLVIQQQNANAAAAAAEAIANNAAALQLQAQYAQAGIAMSAAQAAGQLQLEANASNAANTANVAGTGAKGTNTYLTYGILGLAILLAIGAVMIFTHKTQK